MRCAMLWTGAFLASVLAAGVCAASAGSRPTVAVIDFVPEGRLAQFSPKAGETLADHLRRRIDPARCRVLDRPTILSMAKQRNLSMGDLTADLATVYLLGRQAQIDHAVVGRIVKRGQQWLIYARLVDCRKETVGTEQEAALPQEEFPETVLAALVQKLGLPAAAATSQPATGTAPAAPPEKPLRVVWAGMTEAARLYWHPRGWEFAQPEKALEVVVAIKVAALPGRKLSSQERAMIRGLDEGDLVVDINHSDFKIEGASQPAPGTYHVGYAAGERVPDQYLSGYRRVGETSRLAWKCTSLTSRHYFYKPGEEEVEVSVVFPMAAPPAAARLVYRDWAPVDVGAVALPAERRPLTAVPPDALRVVSVREVDANAILRDRETWMVSAAIRALEVTVELKARYAGSFALPAEDQAAVQPPPAGDQAVLFDVTHLRLKTRAGKVLSGAPNVFTGLAAGARLDSPVQRGTVQTADGDRTLWLTKVGFVRTYYFAKSEGSIQAAVLFPGVTAAEVEAVRYSDWPPVAVSPAGTP